MGYLPFELYGEIGEYLDDKSFFKLIITCKSMHSLYKHKLLPRKKKKFVKEIKYPVSGRLISVRARKLLIADIKGKITAVMAARMSGKTTLLANLLSLFIINAVEEKHKLSIYISSDEIIKYFPEPMVYCFALIKGWVELVPRWCADLVILDDFNDKKTITSSLRSQLRLKDNSTVISSCYFRFLDNFNDCDPDLILFNLHCPRIRENNLQLEPQWDIRFIQSKLKSKLDNETLYSLINGFCDYRFGFLGIPKHLSKLDNEINQEGFLYIQVPE